MSLHERIQEARKNKGFTQAVREDELGNIIGVAKTTVSGYEKNREPTAALLGAIADALDVDVTFLLQDEIKQRRENTASPVEMEFIKKYRALDEHGKDMVNTVLEKELTRVKGMQIDDAEAQYKKGFDSAQNTASSALSTTAGTPTVETA